MKVAGGMMTRTVQPSSSKVEVATRADLRAAIKHALDRADCTFDELAAQAKTGHFRSIRARAAWVAIGDLYPGV
jgi:hypothetical protein